MIQILQETRFQENGSYNWPNTTWPWATNQLSKEIHTSSSNFLLCCELEHMFNHILNPLNPKFKYEKSNKLEKKLNDCSGWFAISHQYQKKLEQYKILRTLKSKSYFKNCEGIITLSEDLKKYWQLKLPKLKIYNVYLPAPTTKYIFDINIFKQNPFMRSLGCWGRKYDIYKSLSHKWNIHKPSNEELLPKSFFEKTFINTIHFIDLEGASANTGVIECIRRNTPLLINRLPSVIEYLGNSYPFYFSSINEANYKINNLTLISETHNYLKRKNKKFIDIQYFIDSVKNIISQNKRE